MATQKFSKEDHSSFGYWFAHWCAYNMTALSLHAWKPKYLLHDIEKPWLKMLMPYKAMIDWHRRHNSHHMDYHKGVKKVDYEAMMIDWECSRFTKANSPLGARDFLSSIRERIEAAFNDADREYFMAHANEALDKLSL